MPSRVVTTSLALAALLVVALSEANAVSPAKKDKKHRPAKAKLVSKVYPVADLIVPLDNHTDRGIAAVALFPVPTACSTAPKKPKTMEDKLIKLITQTIAPETWSENGGQGTLDYYALGMSLVVRQRLEVHEQLADLLQSLRQLQDLQIGIEVRVVSLPESTFERIGIDWNDRNEVVRHHQQPTSQAQQFARTATGSNAVFLTDVQVFQILEAIQEDPGTNVMQAPKMTLFNGQVSVMDLTEKQFFVTNVEKLHQTGGLVLSPRKESFKTGLEMSVHPVLSSDRRYVHLNLKLNLTSLKSALVPLFPVVTPITPVKEDGQPAGKPVMFTQYIQQPQFNTISLDRTFKIPDGQTVLIDGGKQVREVRSECGPAFLSKVPYVSRVFKNVGYARETESLLFLITPRIIVAEEEELQQTPRTDPVSRREKKVQALLKKYHQACSEDRLADATNLAVQALALDPTCFSK